MTRPTAAAAGDANSTDMLGPSEALRVLKAWGARYLLEIERGGIMGEGKEGQKPALQDLSNRDGRWLQIGQGLRGSGCLVLA